MMMVEHCRTTPKSVELAAAAFLDRVLACFKASAKVLTDQWIMCGIQCVVPTQMDNEDLWFRDAIEWETVELMIFGIRWRNIRVD